MNAFDWALVAVAAGCVAIGLVKGLARILITIASLVVAFLLASHFQDAVAARLMGLGVVEPAARLTAYIAIFAATMIAGGLTAWLVGKLLELVLLGWADRLAGGAVGLVAALLAAAFVVHPLVASSESGRRLLRNSVLAPYASAVADVANAAAPDDMAERYEKEIGRLRSVWSDLRERRD